MCSLVLQNLPMKKRLLVLLAGALGLASFESSAQRYTSEVFQNVSVDQNIFYSRNISVLTGSPVVDSLRMDIYRPAGDTSTKRPLIIYLHTGSFLPPIVNGSPTGSRRDSATVAICKRFAQRGFVVAAPSYRLGWNPQGNQQVRTGTILNAVYRGTIDAKTAVRWFRRNHQTLGNTYGIDTSRIVMVGQGTGGYLALTAATLNKVSELNLPKFIDPTTSASYVNQALVGNFDGTDSTTLNLPNWPTFSSRIHMAVNLAGALGDSTWLEAGEVPIIGMHSPTDPFAPFTAGVVLVPGTSFQVVDVSGSRDIVRRANNLGNNNIINNAVYTDPYSQVADALNGGVKGLYPLYIAPTNRPQAGPWDFWDSTIVKSITLPPSFSGATAHSNAMLTNPNMSKTKSNAYIDTVVNFISPRIVNALSLFPVSVRESNNVQAAVYPNPSKGEINLRVSDNNRLIAVEVLDLNGRIIYREEGLRDSFHRFNTPSASKGLYFVRIHTEEGTAVQKVMLD